ncbi:putative Acid phosphatase [Lupinus albus]|uniref:Putative Acid phosphatase n=1 Tax=Lupinus albus TaxID=3870 RepID=A0A6A4Q1G9_LUPAL|nr:putative Acid phosphatase [Lupinus albus]
MLCAYNFIDPPLDISYFRERSFGHGTLKVVNASHALWTWIKNDDDKPVISESLWFTSLSSYSACKV